MIKTIEKMVKNVISRKCDKNNPIEPLFIEDGQLKVKVDEIKIDFEKYRTIVTYLWGNQEIKVNTIPYNVKGDSVSIHSIEMYFNVNINTEEETIN